MRRVENTLYVQSQGAYVHLDHETVRVEHDGRTLGRVPLHHLGAIVVFGNVLVSPFLVAACAGNGLELVWLTRWGRFAGRLAGPVSGNVLLRRAQHEASGPAGTGLALARLMVAGKLQNARGTLLRSAREASEPEDRRELGLAAGAQAAAIRALPACSSLDGLRGIEGNAARAYFGAFSRMVRSGRASFSLPGRVKRPATDRMNSLLNFVYALVRGECAAACETVGLDPQVGFLHALRPGRPALALDLMEELRPCLADRLALTLVNRGQLSPGDFIERPGGAVELDESGRKTVLETYEKRKREELTHPALGEKIPFGLVPQIQARLLARVLRGDLESYPPFILR